MGYTLRLTDQAVFVDDETASIIRNALDERMPSVQVRLQLEGDDMPAFEMYLNTAHIIGLIRHRAAVLPPAPEETNVVQFSRSAERGA